MFIFSYTAAILSIIFFVFALVILLKVKNSYQAIFLALYMLAVALWIGANAAADVSSTDSSLIFWTGMGSVGGSFFISFYLCFVDNFIHEHFPKKLNILLYLLPGVILSLFSFSHYSIVATFFPPNLPAQIIPGILFYFYLVFLFGGLLYGGIRLAIAYRNALSQKKKQILYMELGFISIFCGAAIFSLILPLFGELRFFTAGPQFAAFTIFFTAYAIFRHKLLDLRIIIQRGLIYTVLFAIIVLFYLTILFIAQSIFVGGSRTIYVFTAIITCVVGIFSVPKLDNWLRRVTDRVFFKDRYDSAEVLHSLSETLNRNLDLSDLVLKTTSILKNSLKIKEIYINLLPHEQEKARQELEILEEKYNLPLTLRLEREGRLIGAMFLGSKLSGDSYIDDDIGLLRTFTHQMTLALEKSGLYEQVKDYSKNLEKKIAERTVELKNLQEKQSQELFDIAHELQTPLTVLKSELSVLITNCPEKEKIEHLEKNIDRISGFINSLLKLARLDFADELKVEKINFSLFLLDLAEEFNIIAQGNSVIFEHNIEENIFINGDRNKLGELASNLVSNAIKYIANERKVTINLRKIDGWAELEVIDTGMGISSDDLPYLFDRFYRSSKALSGGTGLGLAICKKIVMMHNGEIKIKSQAGFGTTVEVLVPINE